MAMRSLSSGTLLLGILLLASLSAACSSGPSTQGPTDGSTSYSGVLAATQFLVGENRFPFGLINVDGEELREAAVLVRFYSLNQDEPQLRAEHPAQWRETVGITPHLHADGQLHEHTDVRGVYVVDSALLDEPGIWGADFEVTALDGRQPMVQGAAFQVDPDSSVPQVGERVPPTQNPTIHDVEHFSDLSTRLVEDDLHEFSVAQALQEAKPFVVVFSSPQFCISRMCGPVTDMAAAVHRRHRESVNFIHIEPWDLNAARNEGSLVASEAMREWSLPTEPWVFVVDTEGRVAARFEGLVSDGELEQAVLAVLTPS